MKTERKRTEERGGYEKLNMSVTDQSGSKGGEEGVQSGWGLEDGAVHM